MSKFNKTVLSNGVRVISEKNENSNAVAIGIWCTIGTRDEDPKLSGISHFTEHLVFKGTKKRSSFQIAKSLEQYGGDLNAYTTREYTVYHCLVLKDHWRQGLDVLTDLITGMKLTEKDFALEKSVVMQEIAMTEDNHDDIIFDEYLKRNYPQHPIGKSILGTIDSLKGIKSKDVKKFYKEMYQPENLIVSCSGNIDHEDLLQETEKRLKSLKSQKKKSIRTKPNMTPFYDVIEKNADQLHLLLGFPATSYQSELRFEAFIFNALLGGGMTSRLYQKIREKKGLAYSIYSSLNTFTDSGLILVYAASEPKQMNNIVKTIFADFNLLKEQKVKSINLNMFKTQLTGSILLGSDDVENRMTSLAVNEMVLGRYKPVEEIIADIEAVNHRSMKKYIEQFFDVSQVSGLLLGAGANNHKEWFAKYFNN